ncbi:MAG TPA: protealysin inhibitor emfourin [Pyrinomonadaceae bacterium]|jgi:hypothetical protein
MRIRFEEKGGIAFFPGLSQPIAFGTDQLGEEEMGQLRQLIDAARFFELPATVGAPSPGAADYKQYTITIEDHGKSHTVRLLDPVSDPDLGALLNFIRGQARASRSPKRTP